jgi:hypothetical protein
MIQGIHSLAERADALLKVTFKALRRVSLDPAQVGVPGRPLRRVGSSHPRTASCAAPEPRGIPITWPADEHVLRKPVEASQRCGCRGAYWREGSGSPYAPMGVPDR